MKKKNILLPKAVLHFLNGGQKLREHTGVFNLGCDKEVFLEEGTVSPLHMNLFPSKSLFVSPVLPIWSIKEA